MLARSAEPAPFDSGQSIAAVDLQPRIPNSRCGWREDSSMIPQFWSRSWSAAKPRGRHLFVVLHGLVVLALVAAATQSTSAAKAAEDSAGKLSDPLKGTPRISPEKTGQEANKVLAKMLKPRSDSWADWNAPIEPLHRCGEPRALPPCVPPPPCHPSMPPAPYDLVGMQGVPSGGPIYEGPCQPRTGTHDDCPHPHVHRLYDRFFDLFYKWK